MELRTQGAIGIDAVSAAKVADSSPHTVYPPFTNRDLSLLEFFRRVLDEGLDKSQPLLERLKFLSIVSSNLDEFFMIRVSALKEKIDASVGVSLDGYTRGQLLREIRFRVLDLNGQQAACFNDDILGELTREGIDIVEFDALSRSEREVLNERFWDEIYPLLTPQAVDPTHPFPYISAASLNVGLVVRPTLSRRVARAMRHLSDEFFVRIKIPSSVPRFIRIHGDSDRFVMAEDLIRANIRRLIPEASPASCHLFRITRDADIAIREEETEDLLQAMEETLKLRRFGDVVRLEVSDSMPASMIDYLSDSLGIGPDDVYRINGPLDLTALSEISSLNRPDLKEPRVKTITPAIFDSGRSAFDVIRGQDILLHHPYMPYSIVTDFIKEAAADPDVLAIKMCLYRIGAESPIAPILIEASERGKQVTALIEIKARFDEANNIEWGKRLEEAGIHVIYGMLGLKTHCKTSLIVRRENGKLVRYMHVATGNYNPETSAFYTDLGLLTADQEIGEDATELFNYLTVYSQRDAFKRLIVAPIDLRERTLFLIRRETEKARHGRPARILAKVNRLADAEIVNSLYEASAAGVEIDLIVRGVCTLRAGVEGLSENIRVRSIVGGLLEHSRAYYFENGGNEEIYIGSSDWMPRNLDRRIEVLVPILDPAICSYIKNEFFTAYLRDTTKARELLPDGSYRRVEPPPGEKPFNSQLSFQGHSNVVPFGGIGRSDNFPVGEFLNRQFEK